MGACPNSRRPNFARLLRLAGGAMSLVAIAPAGCGGEVKMPESGRVSYETASRIFEANCWKCHGEEGASGKLRLHTLQDVLKGGQSGPVVVPGDAAGSLLIRRVKGEVEGKKPMPPKGGPLPDGEIAVLAAWIAQGAE